uniref:C3H1-type domain-containing protein n=1 Tax=Parascaris univalens TaxID=6257 RepID=A0A915CD86_PARUN
RMDKLNKYSMRSDRSVLWQVINTQHFYLRDSSTMTDEELIALQKRKRRERAYKTALCPLFTAGECSRGQNAFLLMVRANFVLFHGCIRTSERGYV